MEDLPEKSAQQSQPESGVEKSGIDTAEQRAEAAALEPSVSATERANTAAAEPPETVAASPVETAVPEPAEAAATQTAEPATAEATQSPPAQPATPRPTGPRMGDLRLGMVVEGTVTRIEKYGAFVNIGLVERRDGLIHISELSPHRIRRVEDVVRVGDEVRARVVGVDLGRGRISLSLNDVDEDLGAAEATSGPAEPALTAMQLAFERAYGRRREREGDLSHRPAREDVGARKKREHESLMNRLRTSGR